MQLNKVSLMPKLGLWEGGNLTLLKGIYGHKLLNRFEYLEAGSLIVNLGASRLVFISSACMGRGTVLIDFLLV